MWPTNDSTTLVTSVPASGMCSCFVRREHSSLATALAAGPRADAPPGLYRHEDRLVALNTLLPESAIDLESVLYGAEFKSGSLAAQSGGLSGRSLDQRPAPGTISGWIHVPDGVIDFHWPDRQVVPAVIGLAFGVKSQMVPGVFASGEMRVVEPCQ